MSRVEKPTLVSKCSFILFTMLFISVFCLSVIRDAYYVITFHTCIPFYFLNSQQTDIH